MLPYIVNLNRVFNNSVSEHHIKSTYIFLIGMSHAHWETFWYIKKTPFRCGFWSEICIKKILMIYKKKKDFWKLYHRKVMFTDWLICVSSKRRKLRLSFIRRHTQFDLKSMTFKRKKIYGERRSWDKSNLTMNRLSHAITSPIRIPNKRPIYFTNDYLFI